MLELHTLGSVDLLGTEGEEVSGVLSQPKRLALLVYLAVEPGPHRRDTLLTLFWPESDETHARNALSQSLTYLRQYLSEDAFIGRRSERIGMAAGALQSDVETFDTAIQAGRWATALDLYRGDFLRGFHVAGAWGFEEWAEEERQRLRKAAAGAAWSLAHEQAKRGALVEARRTAEKALGLVCADESPVREFMRALAGAGDRAAALKFFESYCAVLKRELELEPCPATQEVAEAIRKGDVESRRPSPGPSPAPSSEPAPGILGPKEASEAREPHFWRQHRWAVWSFVGATSLVLAAVGIVATRPGAVGSDPPTSVRSQLTFRGDVVLASWSPDGRTLAYVVGGQAGEIIVQDLAGGGELVVADSIGPAHDLRWSPNGSKLAFAGFHRGKFGTYLFPRFGGAPGELPYRPRLAWSPEGGRIAAWWQSTESGVTVHHLRSGKIDSIPIPGSDPFTAGGDWSPQGDYLALVTLIPGAVSHLWVFDLEDKTHYLAFSSPVRFYGPRWSPGGEAIYVSRRNASGGSDLYKLDLEPEAAQPRTQDRPGQGLGEALSWVTSFECIDWTRMSISRNGQRLAYLREYEHTNFSILRPQRGGRTEHVTLTTGTADKRCPRLSPDGNTLAYLQWTLEGWSLQVVPTVGGETVRLHVPGSLSFCPAWAPDGRRLAVGTAIDRFPILALVPVEGGDPLVIDDTQVASDISWGPSSLVAFQVPGNRNVRLLDPDSGGEGRLLVPDDSVGWMFRPRVSPDGTKVAVVWNYSQGFDRDGLWVISLTDGSRTRLAPLAESERPIGWSIDGQEIFTVDPEGVVRSYSAKGGEGVIVPQPPGTGGLRCEPHERPGELFWVCSDVQAHSDVWMIEDFDPGYRR